MKIKNKQNKNSIIGRPTKFKSEYSEMLVNHMKDGYSFESFGAVISVHYDTLYEWCKRHSRFSDAKKIGNLYERLYWEGLLLKISTGQTDKIEKRVTKYNRDGKPIQVIRTEEPSNMNVTSIIFALKNKFPKEWRDRKQFELNNFDENTDSNLKIEFVTAKK